MTAAALSACLPFRRQAADAPPDDAADAVGQHDGLEIDIGLPLGRRVATTAPVPARWAQELADEERVALGLPPQQVGEVHGLVVELVAPSWATMNSTTSVVAQAVEGEGE